MHRHVTRRERTYEWRNIYIATSNNRRDNRRCVCYGCLALYTSYRTAKRLYAYECQIKMAFVFPFSSSKKMNVILFLFDSHISLYSMSCWWFAIDSHSIQLTHIKNSECLIFHFTSLLWKKKSSV